MTVADDEHFITFKTDHTRAEDFDLMLKLSTLNHFMDELDGWASSSLMAPTDGFHRRQMLSPCCEASSFICYQEIKSQSRDVKKKMTMR